MTYIRPQADQARSLSWVKRRNTRGEQMFSALPPKPDIAQCSRHVRNVPTRDSCTAANQHLYSITSSARCSSDDAGGDANQLLHEETPNGNIQVARLLQPPCQIECDIQYSFFLVSADR